MYTYVVQLLYSCTFEGTKVLSYVYNVRVHVYNYNKIFYCTFFFYLEGNILYESKNLRKYNVHVQLFYFRTFVLSYDTVCTCVYNCTSTTIQLSTLRVLYSCTRTCVQLCRVPSKVQARLYTCTFVLYFRKCINSYLRRHLRRYNV